MSSLKLTAYTAIAGFVLSILAGIIGSVSFGALVFRALLSALICGGVAFGAHLLYNNYLDGDLEIDVSTNTLPTGTKGNHVNIVLEDEPLPDDDSAPGFVLDAAKEIDIKHTENVKTDSQIDNVSDVGASISNATVDTTVDKDVPELKNNDSEVATGSDTSSVNFQPHPIQAVAKSSSVKETEDFSGSENNDNLADVEIQDLPDIQTVMGDFVPKEIVEDSSSVIEDSDFASTGKSMFTEEATTIDASANAKDLAAAIRTVMIKDK
ncbi:MAG TPA: hypothetical protein VFC68_00105 [Treponemataceae bacterium]|nr:hypothetical protein [Treponemataceae bacterium]